MPFTNLPWNLQQEEVLTGSGQESVDLGRQSRPSTAQLAVRKNTNRTARNDAQQIAKLAKNYWLTF